ncbi:MAG: protein-tyrosine phosphatase [Actinomycetota bacterium]|nr:protein-tyrosine phosphatase [Actinomycetota bacterium]
MQRFIALEGASNFRDLGGLRTASGGTTRWRRVFRSDTLQELTDADVKIVRGELGVGTVIDLRTTREITNEGRGPLEAEPVAYVHLPFIGELEVRDEVPETVERDILADYVRMLDTAGHLVAEAVNVIGSSDAPVVFHCAAGKDRTGILAAIVESLAGVPRDAVVADYTRTNEVIAEVTARLARLDTYLNVRTRPADSFRCQPTVMEGFLDVLHERYGGADGWAREAGADAEAIRTVLG